MKRNEYKKMGLFKDSPGASTATAVATGIKEEVKEAERGIDWAF